MTAVAFRLEAKTWAVASLSIDQPTDAGSALLPRLRACVSCEGKED
nr:hypothetical protein [Brucella intermedia]